MYTRSEEERRQNVDGSIEEKENVVGLGYEREDY